MQLNIKSSEAFELPSVEDVEKELKVAPNLTIIKQRIFDVMQVVSFFFQACRYWETSPAAGSQAEVAWITQPFCSKTSATITVITSTSWTNS